LFGGGAHLFVRDIRTVVRPVSIMLFVAGLSVIVAGYIFLRRLERELAARADSALSGLPPGA
jgi:hypothetical protein